MKVLEDIGLTKKEAEIYECLLRLGDSPVSALFRSLEVHPQIVYRAVEALEKKGLVVTVLKKNKKWVSPENPRKLQEIERERAASLKRALPELLKLMKPKKDLIAKTSLGDEAIRSFRRMAISELKRSDTLYIIGGSGDRFYEIMGYDHGEIENKRIKKMIHKKLIAFSSEKEKFLKDPYRLHAEFRFLSSSHPTTSSINIFGDNVGIIIWSGEPILLHIRSHEVASSYKHYFDELWKVAAKN